MLPSDIIETLLPSSMARKVSREFGKIDLGVISSGPISQGSFSGKAWRRSGESHASRHRRSASTVAGRCRGWRRSAASPGGVAFGISEALGRCIAPRNRRRPTLMRFSGPRASAKAPGRPSFTGYRRVRSQPAIIPCAEKNDRSAGAKRLVHPEFKALRPGSRKRVQLGRARHLRRWDVFRGVLRTAFSSAEAALRADVIAGCPQAPMRLVAGARGPIRRRPPHPGPAPHRPRTRTWRRRALPVEAPGPPACFAGELPLPLLDSVFGIMEDEASFVSKTPFNSTSAHWALPSATRRWTSASGVGVVRLAPPSHLPTHSVNSAKGAEASVEVTGCYKLFNVSFFFLLISPRKLGVRPCMFA